MPVSRTRREWDVFVSAKFSFWRQWKRIRFLARWQRSFPEKESNVNNEELPRLGCSSTGASGIGFEWNPVLVDLKSEEVVWRSISPNVRAYKPQKRSWNQIYQPIVTGSYYVAGPNIGSIM